MNKEDYMTKKDYIVFLNSVLIKLQNAINFLIQEKSKHILCYHKVLGVQQKIAGLPKEYKNKLFVQLITVRGIINYLLNGRYDEALKTLIALQKEISKILHKLQNEDNSK